MMKKIALVVQNETHAQNSIEIYDAIRDKYQDYKPIIILMDGMTGMNNTGTISTRSLRTLKCNLKMPFPLLDRFAQLRAMWSLRQKLENLAEDIDVLVFGNDGAPERLMAERVHRRGGRVVMLCDGFLAEWPENGWGRFVKNLKRNSIQLLGFFAPNYMLPSYVGHSKMDLICVMNRNVADVLRSQGVKTPIEVVTLPRHIALFEAVSQEKKDRLKTNKIHTLYATGAWAWHRYTVEECLQQQDIEDLRRFAAKHKNSVHIKVRVHPRDSIEAYGSFMQTENFTIGTTSTPLTEDLGWADCLLTARSSMLQEAAIVGLPGYVYAQNFPVPSISEISISPESYTVIDELQELMDLQANTLSSSGISLGNTNSVIPLILSGT